jgi:hypothetical protein
MDAEVITSTVIFGRPVEARIDVVTVRGEVARTPVSEPVSKWLDDARGETDKIFVSGEVA